MLGKYLKQTSRAALVAYGSWGLLTILLVAGTLTSLSQAERTGTEAVLARAEAGAVAIEQTMLRVFEAAEILQTLAQTRFRLEDARNDAGTQAIDQQILDTVAAGHVGIGGVAIYRHGALEWSSDTAGDAREDGALDGAVADPPDAAVRIDAPATAGGNHWLIRTHWPLRDKTGTLAGEAMIWLDPVLLSTTIGSQTSGPGAVSAVQRREDARYLARSEHPGRAWLEHPSVGDAAFAMAIASGRGQIEDRSGGRDRLIGVRSPAAIPIVVAQSFDSSVALSGFYHLRRIVLSVVLALGFGSALIRAILACTDVQMMSEVPPKRPNIARAAPNPHVRCAELGRARAGSDHRQIDPHRRRGQGLWRGHRHAVPGAAANDDRHRAR